MHERPDWVLVYGDTNSTMAGAVAASKLLIPVAHVEAGLRSYNRRMPEEVNRVITDHVSQVLFAPTETAVKNLVKEGITQGVQLVGDVMHDSILQTLALTHPNQVLGARGLTPGGYYLLTVHRPQNADDPEALVRILSAVARLDLPVVFPVHPRTRSGLSDPTVRTLLERTPNIMLVEPFGYLDMLAFEQGARVILTDSGGVQKEAFMLRVPCVTLREGTEWCETVETGWNALVGSDPGRIQAAVLAAATRPAGEPPAVYGDGHAAKRIVEFLTV